MALNAKQKRFVNEYLIDLNATQAAIRSGYEFCSDTPAGYYVYLLCHPGTGVVFYVGKGKGRRIKTHAAEAKRGTCSNKAKEAEIRSILESGRDVVEIVFCSSCDESEAYAIERHLIAAMKGCGLTNISLGTMTSLEGCKKRAAQMVASMRPFDDWAASLSADKLKQVIAVWGSKERCYTSFRSSLVAMAGA